MRINNFITKVYKKIDYLFSIYLLTDKQFLSRKYKHVFGKQINWANPQTLNEKLQWLKLYDRKPIYTKMVGKYSAKIFIAEHIGEKYVVPNLGVWDSFDEINFEKLPNQFVLKTTAGGGGTGVVICRNKDSFDIESAKKKLTASLHSNMYRKTKEWPYKNVPPKIIAEVLLVTDSGKIPNDYKFHFINGELQFVYVSYDREGINDRCLYDKDWNRQTFVWVEECNYRPTMNKAEVPRPENFDEMLEVGKKIASMMKYVRVDFYDVAGHLYIGEITLYHGSGFDKFFPDEFDLYFGKKMIL